MLTDLASKYQSPFKAASVNEEAVQRLWIQFLPMSSLAVYLPPLQRFFFSIPLQIDPQAPSKLSLVNLGRFNYAPGRRE